MRRSGGPATVVLVTDGVETCDGDLCQVVRDARAAGVELRLHVVGFDLGAEEVSIRTCKGPETNPATLLLPDGTCDLEVRPMGMRGVPPVTFPGVEVAEGREARRDADFTTGELRVGAVRGGELVDATVHVVRAEDGQQVGSGRTYVAETTNPKAFTLSPGRYRVDLGAVKLPGSPKRSLEVTVEAGKTVTVTADFGGG